MRHGYGAALLDLPPEQRDDAAVAAEDIAEAHGYEFCFGALRHGLHDHLTDALARTHDVRRVHGLIRRDEHEGLRAVAVRSLRHMERSEYVIFNGLVRASLHQRHMLVRRSVEHDVRPVLRKQGADPH